MNVYQGMSRLFQKIELKSGGGGGGGGLPSQCSKNRLSDVPIFKIVLQNLVNWVEHLCVCVCVFKFVLCCVVGAAVSQYSPAL